jgi:hypothetical protein
VDGTQFRPEPGAARGTAGSGDLRLFVAALACHGLLLLVVAVAARYLHAPQPLLVRFDAGWYVRTAREGYPHAVVVHAGRVRPSTLAFFPLYPLLGRVLSVLTRVPVGVALMAVSVVSGAAATPVIRRVVARYRPGPVATVTAWAWVFTPLAGLTVIGYTEALYVLLGAGFLLAVLRRRWAAAIGLGLAVALTRPTGLAFAVVALPAVLSSVTSARGEGGSGRPDGARAPGGSGRPDEARAPGGSAAAPLRGSRAGSRGTSWVGPLGALLAPVAGFAGWMAVLRWRTGRWDSWWAAEQAWNATADGGLRAAGWVYNLATRSGPVGLVLLGYLVVLAVLAVVVLAGDAPAAVKLYTVAVVVTVVMARKEVPRFLMPAFTLPVPAADLAVRWARGSARRYAALAVVAAVVALAGAVFVLFLNHEPP